MIIATKEDDVVITSDRRTVSSGDAGGSTVCREL